MRKLIFAHSRQSVSVRVNPARQVRMRGLLLVCLLTFPLVAATAPVSPTAPVTPTAAVTPPASATPTAAVTPPAAVTRPAPVVAPGDELTIRMSQRLGQASVLRAEFVQEKTMAAFKRPLQTRGRFVFARGHGVIWMIETPFKLTYVLAADRIVEIGEDNVPQVRTARDVPGLGQIASIFRALLDAQIDALSETFMVRPEGTLDAWRLTLTPKQGPLTQVIHEIRMSGGLHVDRVRIDEANGDNTIFVFRNTTEDRALTPVERTRFELR